jgi:hypothetical protein
MQTLVISYYADVDGNTYYSDHAKRFKTDCDTLGIPYEITEIQSQGNYQQNCLLKPKFIYSKLTQYQKPLLWLDIDTFILKRPDIFDTMNGLGVDIGVSSTETNNLVKIKASPLWFAYTPDSLEFIRQWIQHSEFVRATKGSLFDHETFIGCLNTYINEKKKKIAILNEDYCAWPGKINENTVLMMGLSDAPSKKEGLKKMGYSDDLIEWQSPGNSFMEVKS